MARVTRITTVCDGCGNEHDTIAFRVGGATGNTKTLDLCETCRDRPFGEVIAQAIKVSARTSTRGRRPATVTPEQLDKIKADRAAAEAVANGAALAKAPRKRAAPKQAAPK